MGDLIDDYRAYPGIYDEMAAPDRSIRSHYQDVATALAQFGTEDLTDRAEQSLPRPPPRGDLPRGGSWPFRVPARFRRGGEV